MEGGREGGNGGREWREEGREGMEEGGEGGKEGREGRRGGREWRKEGREERVGPRKGRQGGREGGRDGGDSHNSRSFRPHTQLDTNSAPLDCTLETNGCCRFSSADSTMPIETSFDTPTTHTVLLHDTDAMESVHSFLILGAREQTPPPTTPTSPFV
jgi:hypothetical protein